MIKNEKIPVWYSVGVKNLPHALGVGNVAAVLLYVHYKTQEEGDDDVEELDYQMIDKKVLWQNGDAKANWEAIKKFVDEHLINWFPEGAKPVHYYERRTLGYALEAYQKDEVVKIFNRVFDELNVESDHHWQWDEKLELETKEYEPVCITFKEKHSESCYLAKTPRDAGNIYMHVLKHRRDTGEYNWMQESRPFEEKPAYTKEEIDSLPVSMEKEKSTMYAVLARYENDLKNSSKHKKWWMQINQAIEDMDPFMAKRLIEQFKDNEYEGFEVNTFDTFEKFNLNIRD